MESFFAEIEDGKLISTPNKLSGKHKVIITLLEDNLDSEPKFPDLKILNAASAGKAFDEFREDEVEYAIDDLKVRY